MPLLQYPLFCFYPRHPRGWRPARFRAQASRKNVSIHATLAGGDRKGGHDHIHGLVSIHATLAGGDGGVPSLLPVRRRVSIHATLAGGDSSAALRCRQGSSFYPRHPRGWRHDAPDFMGCGCRVSIHATLAGGDDSRVNVDSARNVFLSTPPSRVATSLITSQW